MAPKKATKAATTGPTRRSARIASREPSQEPSQAPSQALPRAPSVASNTSETVNQTTSKKVVKKNEVTKWKADDAIRDIKTQQRTAKSLKKPVDVTWINKYIHKLTPAQLKAVILGFAAQVNNLEDEALDLQAEKESAEADRDAALKERPRTIRRDFMLARIQKEYEQKLESALVTSPQQQELENATESDTLAPSPIFAERDVPTIAISNAPSPPQQVAESITTSPAPTPSPVAGERAQSGWRRMFSAVGALLKRGADDDATAPPSPKRVRLESAEKTPSPPPTTTPSPAPILEAEVTEVATPLPSQKRKRAEEKETPSRSFLLQSTKDPRRETSLSTITEVSEPLSVSQISMGTPQNQSTPVAPFLMRRAAQLRAARSAGLKIPKPQQYAWERQASTPKPKEPNADVRLAKLQRMRELQKELNELEQDADIKDMEAQSVHRRKRVKIDNLAVIPHNRPGDSASTFRVPDIDSDDEMEVDDNITERSNIFEDIAAENAQNVSEQQNVPTFLFPDAGQKPADYRVTEDYKEQAGSLFSQGFREYLEVV